MIKCWELKRFENIRIWPHENNSMLIAYMQQSLKILKVETELWRWKIKQLAYKYSPTQIPGQFFFTVTRKIYEIDCSDHTNNICILFSFNL